MIVSVDDEGGLMHNSPEAVSMVCDARSRRMSDSRQTARSKC